MEAAARALVALFSAYVPLRLACTAFAYCRENGPQNGPECPPSRWSRAADWITRRPRLFRPGRHFLAGPAALCLVAVMASGAARLYM